MTDAPILTPTVLPWGWCAGLGTGLGPSEEGGERIVGSSTTCVHAAFSSALPALDSCRSPLSSQVLEVA